MFRALCAHHQEVNLYEYYTASGIIIPVGGRPMHKLREDSSLNLCTGRSPKVWWYQIQYNKILTPDDKHNSARNI